MCLRHATLASRSIITPSLEMQQSMNDVQNYFVMQWGVVFHGLLHGHFWADENFTVGECNDIGRRIVIEKIFMDTANDGRRDKIDFDRRDATATRFAFRQPENDFRCLALNLAERQRDIFLVIEYPNLVVLFHLWGSSHGRATWF